MISSIQDIEYLFDKYGISGISLVIIFFTLLIINWICKNLFPYYFRKSKLEKMDEYKDKYLELNCYSEKTNVINKILEAEYGRILLNERNISKQKTIIFLLHYNLCRTIKEAKKFATYLVFKEPQKSLVFNRSLSLSRTFFIGILTILFFGLFVYFRSETKQADIDFDVYMWLILCILSYVLCIVLSLILSQILVNSISTRNLITKNPETIQKISSRLAELNTQEMIDTEEKNSTGKLTIEKDEVKTLKERLAAEREKTKAEKTQKKALVITLYQKQVSVNDIAKTMGTTVKAVEKIIIKNK